MARVIQHYRCSHYHLSVNSIQASLSHLQGMPGKVWSHGCLVEGKGDLEGDMKKIMAQLRLQVLSLFVCLLSYKQRNVSRQREV